MNIKSLRNALFALLLVGSTAAVASASTAVSAGIHVGPSGRAAVDLGFFYDDLAPYGNWIERPSYGWVWTPTAVSTSWRPYQDGRWVWTDDGWVWVTDEPYGWATYHYGRWYDDPEIGWSWVPGDEWGPSWVSWQGGADYVGWAPLPPGVNVSVSLGGGYGGYAYGIAPESYVFVPERDFLSPRLSAYVVPQARIRGFWGRTRNYTNYRFAGGRVFNGGMPVTRFERFGRVPRYQVADLGADFKRYRGGAHIQGNRLALFRPQVQKARVAPPIQRSAARRAVVSAAQFKAAHPNRVRVAAVQRENRVARQQQQVRQRQVKVDQRQAQIARQQVKVDRRQAQQAHQQAQVNRQRGKAVAQQQARVQHRQVKVDQRQARVDRQQVKVDRQRQQQAAVRQHEKAAARQRQQVRVDQRQVRADRQQVRVDRQRQAQSFRPPQKAAPQRAQQAQQRQARQQQAQQRQARQQQRANRPPGGQGGRGGQGNPRHQRGGPGQ